MEAGQDDIYSCWHGGGCSEQHVTLHPCDRGKLIQPSMWARARGSRGRRARDVAHVVAFQGKTSDAEGRGWNGAISCLLERHKAPESHSWQISGLLLESVGCLRLNTVFKLFLLQIYVHAVLYPPSRVIIVLKFQQLMPVTLVLSYSFDTAENVI